jgi:hypothetical protein
VGAATTGAALSYESNFKGCPSSGFRAATDGPRWLGDYVCGVMKSSIRELITVGVIVGLVFAATLGLAGFSSHAGGATSTNMVLPMPTPDPNPQAGR